MKYFKDDKNNVYAYEDGDEEFILDGLIKITETEALAIANPPPTHEELIADADAQKQYLIDQANGYMNSKQWPGKAAIGRLKSDELEQYNLWLDYLDALEVIDTSSAPDINWPVPPEE
ncbi:tail fiber assembly protein [Citrobacter farmeri]|uniref:tail fiber assembly protein n=1 Tax=Citrobacter farmeri TaxID=67824 RepID=UPI003B986CAD